MGHYRTHVLGSSSNWTAAYLVSYFVILKNFSSITKISFDSSQKISTGNENIKDERNNEIGNQTLAIQSNQNTSILF